MDYYTPNICFTVTNKQIPVVQKIDLNCDGGISLKTTLKTLQFKICSFVSFNFSKI